MTSDLNALQLIILAQLEQLQACREALVDCNRRDLAAMVTEAGKMLNKAMWAARDKTPDPITSGERGAA